MAYTPDPEARHRRLSAVVDKQLEDALSTDSRVAARGRRNLSSHLAELRALEQVLAEKGETGVPRRNKYDHLQEVV